MPTVNLIKDWSHKSKERLESVFNMYGFIRHFYREVGEGANAEEVKEDYDKLDSSQYAKAPKDKMVISLCGLQTDRDGVPVLGSEYDTILDYGLVDSSHYYGIDKGPEVIELNRKGYPDGNWICNDFLSGVKKIGDDFNPALINMDLTNEVPRAMKLLFQVISHINKHFNSLSDVVVVVNFLLNNPRFESDNGFSRNAYIDCINGNGNYSLLWSWAHKDGWRHLPLSYQYKAENSNSYMQTVYFYKM